MRGAQSDQRIRAASPSSAPRPAANARSKRTVLNRPQPRETLVKDFIERLAHTGWLAEPATRGSFSSTNAAHAPAVP